MINEFKDAWNLADELAEKDTAEFAKHPYKKLVSYIGKQGNTYNKWHKISRVEYKDEHRHRYFLALLDLLKKKVESNN